MKHLKHWQDPVNALLGAWLIVSPWVLGFRASLPAVIATLVLGVLLFASSVGEMAVPESWEEWLDAVVGVVLIASPWLAAFSNVAVATWNAVVCGAAVVVLALWVLATDDDYGGWLHRLVR